MLEHHIAVPVPARTIGGSRYSQLPRRVRTIIGEVADDHRIDVRELLSGARRRPAAYARFDAAERLRAMTWERTYQNRGYPSLPQIGRWLNRDHTTVLYMLRRARELRG